MAGMLRKESKRLLFRRNCTFANFFSHFWHTIYLMYPIFLRFVCGIQKGSVTNSGRWEWMAGFLPPLSGIDAPPACWHK
jgi:hypothetical protein